MIDSSQDQINFHSLSQHFENSQRYLLFLARVERTELKKVNKGILTSYISKNWETLYKECQCIKELADFLLCSNCSRTAENLRYQCKLTQINSQLISKGVYEILTHIENISTLIREFCASSMKISSFNAQKEEYEFLSYDSIRYRDIKIIKTIPPTMKSHLDIDNIENKDNLD